MSCLRGNLDLLRVFSHAGHVSSETLTKCPHTLRSIYFSSKGASVKSQLKADKEHNVHSQPNHLYKELFDLFIVQANSNIWHSTADPLKDSELCLNLCTVAENSTFHSQSTSLRTERTKRRAQQKLKGAAGYQTEVRSQNKVHTIGNKHTCAPVRVLICLEITVRLKLFCLWLAEGQNTDRSQTESQIPVITDTFSTAKDS